MGAKYFTVPALVFLGSCLLLLPTLHHYGVTWDEAYPNLPAQRHHAQWMRGLFTLEHPFAEETVRQHWQSSSHHPLLFRAVGGLGIALFGDLVSEPTAARIPFAIIFSAFLALLYHWLFLMHRSYWVALWGPLSLLFYPRIFAHAHFSALDLPMAMMWVLMLIIFLWASDKGWKRAILAGLFFGLVLATKLHAYFLPFVFIAYNLIKRRFDWRIYFCMAALGPLVFIIVQPLLWHHPFYETVDRLLYFATKKDEGPIALFFFGHMFRGHTPWYYSPVVLLITMPLTVILCSVYGLKEVFTDKTQRMLIFGRSVEVSEQEQRIHQAIMSRVEGKEGEQHYDWPLMFLIATIVPFAIVLLPMGQAYDGIRLLMPGVLCLIILSTLGFRRICATCTLKLGWLHPKYLKTVPAVILLIMLLPGVCATWSTHPYQLSHYNCLGMPMEYKFERTYWCDGLNRSELDDLNRNLPQEASLWMASGSTKQLLYYQDIGWLRRDIVVQGRGPYDYHLLQVRQGFFSRLGWELYQHGKPLRAYGPEGRPLYLLYGTLEEALPVSSGSPDK
jgi:4-amino-4-deoxy-L-arabinose transferase-like glycosyltransferase